MNGRKNYGQAASAYRLAATAVPPLAKVVMLYDGVIVGLRRTICAIEQKHPEEAFGHLHQATTILRGLCHSLDFERGGGFAERMRDTYLHLILSALHSFGKPDALVRFDKLIVAINGLRDAWSEVHTQLGKADRPTS